MSQHNHLISLDAAKKLTKNFRNTNLLGLLNKIRSEKFDRAAIDELLAQTGAEGIRTYFGLDLDLPVAQIKIIIVATDINGDDMLDMIMEHGYACPPYCPKDNILNS